MANLPLPAPPTITARPRPGEQDEPAEGLVPDYVRKLAWLLDDAIPLFGNRRIGIDGFLSFIPVIGDAAGFGLAAVVLLSGVRAGCSWPTVARMLFHALGESVVGMIPLIGPIIAFAWKSNDRNLKIIESNLRDRDATRRESWKVLLVGFAMVTFLVLLVLAGTVIVIATLWDWAR